MTCGMAWAAPGAGPLRALMDKSALKEGWTRSGKAEFFDKDTLFDLVDGEAEAYFPYGFKGAVSATYTKGGDKAKEANVELYEMGSLLDAYGIYSAMRDTESKQVDVGTEGFGGTTQIMFYADKYFVKATVYSAAAKRRVVEFREGRGRRTSHGQEEARRIGTGGDSQPYAAKRPICRTKRVGICVLA